MVLVTIRLVALSLVLTATLEIPSCGLLKGKNPAPPEPTGTVDKVQEDVNDTTHRDKLIIVWDDGRQSSTVYVAHGDCAAGDKFPACEKD